MNYSITLTNKCNLHCSYCYLNDGRKNGEFVATMDEIDSILTILPPGVLEPIGGEMFMFPDILEYIFTKYKNKFEFEITTNCMVYNTRVEQMIKNYVRRVKVSLDSPATMEKQRFGSNIEQAIRYAKKLSRIKPTTVSSVITPENVGLIKETFDFYCIDNGFDSILFEVDEQSMTSHLDEYEVEMSRLIDSYKWGNKSILNFSRPTFQKKTEYFNNICVDFFVEGDMDTPKRRINKRLKERYNK